MEPILQGVEAIRDAAALLQRLDRVAGGLAGAAGFEREKRWLGDAGVLLGGAVEEDLALLQRAAALPELASVHGELLVEARLCWIDAAEELHGVLARTQGSRAPVIEALFPGIDFASLRRKPAGVDECAATVERLLRSAYVERTLAADPRLEEPKAAMEAAFAGLGRMREPLPVEPDEAIPLRERLESAAERLALVTRQARLLAEAALLPLPDLLEEANLAGKKRRRSR